MTLVTIALVLVCISNLVVMSRWYKENERLKARIRELGGI